MLFKEEPKCGVCLSYLRRIEEVEKTLSGRDAVIKAWQNQFKKCETNYKKLFDEYEQLRFEHTFALPDYSSIREISAKLVCDKKSDPSVGCLSNNAQQSPTIPNDTHSNVLSLLREVGNIEQLVNGQSRVLKELVEKVVVELKLKDAPEVIDTVQDKFKRIESGDHLDLEPGPLKAPADKLEKERNDLGHFNNTLVGNVDKGTIEKQDQETYTGDMADPNYNDLLIRIKMEMDEKERHFEQCSCQLIEQLNNMHNNNQVLSDTLAVITEENKSNLTTIEKLKDELNRTNAGCEENIAILKERVAELENDIEDLRINEKRLRESNGFAENETKELKARLKNAIDENSQIKDCKCEAENKLKTQLVETELRVEELKKELTDKSLELTEYEEENRNFCQKIDILTNYINELTKKSKALEDELVERSKEPDATEMGTQMSATLLNTMETRVAQLTKENECLNEKCKMGQIDAIDKQHQLDSLKSSIKLQMTELDELSRENQSLRKEIERLKNQNKLETERLQQAVINSQKQVETLLKEHDEKTAQIECVANELDYIRRNVVEDNNNFQNRIEQLQREKNELSKIIQEHEKVKDCECAGAREEIDRLKGELIKKQCIILELEKSVDNFNDSLKNFDRLIEELACEKECLRTDRDALIKNQESLRSELAAKTEQLDGVQRKFDQMKDACDRCDQIIKELKEENKQLKMTNMKRQAVEADNELLKKEVDDAKKEKRRLEEQLMNQYQVEMELESLKHASAQRDSEAKKKTESLQKAYDELKKLSDNSQKDNEKLKEDFQKSHKLEQTCDCLRAENQKMKTQAASLFAEVDALKDACNKLKKDCALKCFEVECLKESVEEREKEKRLYDQKCREFKEHDTITRTEMSNLKEQLGKLQVDNEQKAEELKKIKKQWECCAKQSQITRDEYNNLRKEYKEIKTMLSDQIKRYRLDTSNIQDDKPSSKVNDLKGQLLEKEKQISTLQQKLKDSSYEIIELKDYVQKLIYDNNILKSAINNLIVNLENKIKGPSFGSLPSNSAELIAGEILNSLTTIEDAIRKNGCPKGCKNKHCNCMTEILSQYNLPEQQDHPCQIANTVLAKSISEPIDKVVSECNTTDSDDLQLDDRSVDFLKETIKNLKGKIDCTMKEKSCDCERNFKINL